MEANKQIKYNLNPKKAPTKLKFPKSNKLYSTKETQT